MKETLNELTNPRPDQIDADPIEWLERLAGPTVIWIDGRESARTRAVVTLLHGNEPSGLLAIHSILRSGEVPLTNLLLVIVSVEAALLEPRFRYRAYPQERDMNRSFNPPHQDSAGRLALAVLNRLKAAQQSADLEAVLDVHNTSGQSPSFAVATVEQRSHEILAAVFTQRLVITELRLGSLMEQSTEECPVVTVECGGAQEPQSHALAEQGLRTFMQRENLFELDHAVDMDLYHDPVRFELEQRLTLAFAEAPVLGVDLTLLDQVDQFNFKLVPAGAQIGWIRDPDVIKHLRVIDARGNNRFDQYFEICGNRLQTKATQKLFMVTTRPDIALSDCLLYSAFETEHARVHLDERTN